MSVGFFRKSLAARLAIFGSGKKDIPPTSSMNSLLSPRRFTFSAGVSGDLGEGVFFACGESVRKRLANVLRFESVFLSTRVGTSVSRNFLSSKYTFTCRGGWRVNRHVAKPASARGHVCDARRSCSVPRAGALRDRGEARCNKCARAALSCPSGGTCTKVEIVPQGRCGSAPRRRL